MFILGFTWFLYLKVGCYFNFRKPKHNSYGILRRILRLHYCQGTRWAQSCLWSFNCVDPRDRGELGLWTQKPGDFWVISLKAMDFWSSGVPGVPGAAVVNRMV